MATLPIGIDVPLSLFAGLDTELAPVDLPEGVSPANSDVIFLPGSWQTRPGLAKIFPSGLDGPVYYNKTYIMPDGMALNLYLTSTGKLWKEDVANTPGTVTQIGQVTPGSQCTSVTFLGREYFAFSDFIHGVDAPRQYDGTNFDRVTQDGPGTPPGVVDVFGFLPITDITPAIDAPTGELTILNLSEVGNVATCQTTTNHNLTTGDMVLMGTFEFYTNNWNGVTVTVTAPDTFTYVCTQTGNPTVHAGQVFILDMLVTMPVPHNLHVGDAVYIQGNQSNSFNNNTTYQHITITQKWYTTPPTWTVKSVPSSTTFVFTSLSGGNTAGGPPWTGGQINTSLSTGYTTAGTHKCVVLFQTRNGEITQPSPPVQFTSSGSCSWSVTGIPIGPPNVIARILAFTGAGGDNYFYVPVAPFADGVSVGTSTVVMDNTSTSATVNFSDNTLFAGTAIDIPGRNYFACQVLTPSLGVFAYASRLMYWGLDNKIQNLLNMGFDGGYVGALTAPTGWSVVTAGGTLVTSPVDFGFGWQITGTGATDGEVTQPAYEDWEGISIFQADTAYRFKIWGIRSAGAVAGNVVCDLYSATGGGVLSTAFIPVTSFPATVGAFQTTDFNNKLVSPLPADLILRVYASGLTSGQTITLDDSEIIYKDTPYRQSDIVTTYVNAPEQFDNTTGILASATDPAPVQCAAILRDTMRFKTTAGIHTTQDVAGSEPSGWSIASFSRTVGAVSPRSGDPGRFGSGDTAEDWDLTVARGGLYLDFGGDLFKISQEIQDTQTWANGWDSINWQYAHLIWVKNDTVQRRAYIGVPVNGSTTINYLFVWDYRELDAAYQIAASPPVHTSYTGRMIATDLSRKWTGWQRAFNCADILNTQTGDIRLVFGATTESNSYYLNDLLFTDDDFGQIPSYYYTYAFLNHEQEMALGTGLHRKLYSYLTMYVQGKGMVRVTPYADSLLNPLTPTPTINTANIQPSTIGATQVGNIVTIQTVEPHLLQPGQLVTVNGVGVAGYNNVPATPWTVLTTPDRRSFTYDAGVSGLSASGGGTIYGLRSVMQITGQTFDFEWGLNVLCERCFFKIEAVPLPFTTDSYINMNKQVVSIRQSVWSPVRGSF